MSSPRPRRLLAPLVLSALLSLLVTAAPWAEEPEGEVVAADENRIKRVWFREIKQRNATMRKTGDLVLTDERLEFQAAHEKKSFAIRLDDIRTLSYGRLGQDVDTDWIVFALKDHAGSRLLGFRDGRKFGYGTRTSAIYEQLRAAMERSRMAQYDVPDGYRTYDELGKQFTLAYPEQWHSFHQTLIEAGEELTLGRLLFTATELPRDGDARADAVARFENGQSQGFLIEREMAGDGTRCAGVSERARAKWLERVARDSLLGGDNTVVQAPAASAARIDRCDGLRITAQSRLPDGRLASLDYRIVSDGGVTHLLVWRAVDTNADTAATFETIVEHFRLSAARPRR